MSTDIDWQHELDSSFGSGHDVAAGHYVAAGRRAVRRRRIAAVVATAAVVVAGGTVWAVSPGDSVRSDAPVATRGQDPTQDTKDDHAPDRQRVRPESTPSMSVEEEFNGNPAVLEPDGLKMSPLAGEVLQRMPNPMGYTPAQGRSVAIRVIYLGSEKYSFLSLTQDGSSLSTTTHDATGDFAGWVSGVVATERTLDELNGVTAPTAGAPPAPDTWLTLGPDGAVEASAGNVLLEVRAHVDLGDGFAQGATRTGALRMLVGGVPQHAAYRVVDGRLDVIAGPGRFDSLDAFVAWARKQYASGEGMR
jgi:hypothetical protein